MNTNYIPLYRKYRPQAIEQIVGQEHIKKALANAIEMDRISHAYLFTGPRGTGKTSTARIFAKSLNCEKGPTINPCNECENCKNITNSIPIDVIEIDAASNRSVNDAEEIIQQVALAPVCSRYKIYIIDEVHMLTPQAFNALLKTLEEPPKNVIFILATTEVHKVLDTIKSRCQRFDFKRITTNDIVNHLRIISDKENIKITDDALNYIATNSAGGMRDSLALLDQLSVLSSTDKDIDVDDINSLLGRLSFEVLKQLFEAIVNSDKSKSLEVLNDIYNKGNEPTQILTNLLEFFRTALLIKNLQKGEDTNVFQYNKEQISNLKELLTKIETQQIISLINKISDYIKELKQTSNPKLWLDVAIIDLANLVENTKLEDLQKRLMMLETGGVKPVNVSPYNTPPAPVKKVEVMKPIKQEKTPTIKQAEPVKVKEVVENSSSVSQSSNSELDSMWNKFLENVSSFPSRMILKQQAVPVKITSDEVIITIKSQNFLKQFTPDGAKFALIDEAVTKTFGKKVQKIIVRMPEANDNNIRQEQKTSASSDDETPAPAKAKVETKAKEDNKEKIEPPTVVDGFESVNDKQNNVVINDVPDKIVPKRTGDSAFHTDEVNMVKDLFEAKFIE